MQISQDTKDIISTDRNIKKFLQTRDIKGLYNYIIRQYSNPTFTELYFIINKKVNLLSQIDSIKDLRLQCENGVNEALIIPKNIKSITNLVNTFYNSVIFEQNSSCTSIKDIACPNITTLTLPDGLEYIGSMCFVGCFNLKDIYIPDSITELNKSMFRDDMTIHLNSRKGMRRKEQLQVPESQVEWFLSHIQVENQSENKED